MLPLNWLRNIRFCLLNFWHGTKLYAVHSNKCCRTRIVEAESHTTGGAPRLLMRWILASATTTCNFICTYAQYCNTCVAHMYNFPYNEFRSPHKIKLSLCTPGKRMANWRYSSTLYNLDTWCRWAVSYTRNPIYSRWKKLGSLSRRLGEFQRGSGRWEKERIFRSYRELHNYSPAVQPLVYSRDFTSTGTLNLQDIRNFSVLHSKKICNFEHMKNVRRR